MSTVNEDTLTDDVCGVDILKLIDETISGLASSTEDSTTAALERFADRTADKPNDELIHFHDISKRMGESWTRHSACLPPHAIVSVQATKNGRLQLASGCTYDKAETVWGAFGHGTLRRFMGNSNLSQIALIVKSPDGTSQHLMADRENEQEVMTVYSILEVEDDAQKHAFFRTCHRFAKDYFKVQAAGSEETGTQLVKVRYRSSRVGDWDLHVDFQRRDFD